MPSTTPTGATHDVGREDMFFSTTNAKGVIGQANGVFVRIARHPREDLIGAPHNIIRHPDMPGGAFRIVWDALLAGEPTAAYVLNLAGDGSAYWAMASIVPVEEGFLSVRTRPARTDLRDSAWTLYQSVRAAENAARAKGSTAAQAAELGAGLLTEGLAELGFADYAQFVRAMLPAETEARGSDVSIPARPQATGAMRFTLDAIGEVDAQVRSLAIDLRTFRDDADKLDGQLKATQQAIHTLESAVHAASAAARDCGDAAPLLANAAPVVDAKCAAIGTALDQLATNVTELASSRSDLSFRVALAQLQAEMAGRYVVALVDNEEDPKTSDHAVHTLAGALRQGMDGVERGITRNLTATESVRDELKSTSTALRILQMSLGTWRDLVGKFGVQERFAEVLPALDAALESTTSRVGDLTALIDAFGQRRVTFDNRALNLHLHKALHLLDSSAVAGTPA